MSFLIECDIGDSIAVRGTLTDEAGAPVTGATVTARALPPGAAAVEEDLGEATEGDPGVYEVTFDPTVAGPNRIRFDSAEPSKAAAEGIVYARETRFS